MKAAESKGKTKYQLQQKAGNKPSGGRSVPIDKKNSTESVEKARNRELADEIDGRFGFARMIDGSPRLGWLLNYLPMTMPDSTGLEKAGIEMFFIDREGANFKACLFFQPYFLLDIADQNRLMEVSNFLMRKFEGCYASIESKEDLDLPNHLSGLQHRFIKISFNTVSELIECKGALRPKIEQNQQSLKSDANLESLFDTNKTNRGNNTVDPLDCLIDMREYDVPYAMRVAIDLDVRVGAWYTVTPENDALSCRVEWQKDLLELCEPRVLAYDIECEKSPLKFPNPENDRVFMISYMVANQGYLIINREVVSEDIEDFEYTPKPTFPGPFKVINVADEKATLEYFLRHIQQLRPHVITTFNGDRFDWPYLDIRCSKYSGLSLYRMLGISSGQVAGGKTILSNETQYTGRCVVHLDAFCWVQRDSYLPQGNQGLKAVTKYKLGYDPVEVDPEDMVRFAKEKPHHMASYSVSDAVATYYLYNLYVHNFIFSLSTIIPLVAEDVLRKGSGTLCEALLMVEAYKGNIVCPNKQVDPNESFYEGHLLESETYIGGHVECLEAGVFRADIPVKFNLVPSALQQLIDNIDRDLTFAIEVEHGIQRTDIIDYDEVKQAVIDKLETLRDSPDRMESPLIYHLDVGAMYPNIILTNRLQPSSMVSIHDCASCKFNQASNECKRPMTWTWRGEFNPAGASEYNSIRTQLSYEKPARDGPNASKTFSELTPKEQAEAVKTRLKTYSQRVYRKTKVTKIEERVSTVCMRENSFYVDTVKAFRDRRYDYKLLTKVWKNKKNDAEKKGDMILKKQAEDREILMDSLQLAHKCILNSFYGYVMRKGARWRSMEMAGIVTHTGAQLIKQARELVEQVGRPLELDTDGIWCILPSIFPQNFKFKNRKGGTVTVSYPCAMLNADVHERYTNHQYQVLEKAGVDKATATRYVTQSECSIFFELDGPYKAMVLPASPEEGRLLKKKYVVFNFDGSVAELKGFELKRRGELELVKIFQSQVFEQFLAGTTLEECYAAVADIANQWLDVLDCQGEGMDDEELMELISEKKTISKTVDDYEGRKSTSLTTAGRLADFLGAEMIKDKGLNCKLVISRLPEGAPVTDRAIPVAIFNCEPAMRRYFLRKWLKDNTLDCEDFRHIIDWNYYKERLGNTIQKIVTIPAGMQFQPNPVPRVEHPSWLQKRLDAKASGKKQLSIKDAFSSMNLKEAGVATKVGKMQYLTQAPAGTMTEYLQPRSDRDEHSASSPNNNKRVHFGNEEETRDKKDLDEKPSESTLTVDDVDEAADAVKSMYLDPPTTHEDLQRWIGARKKVWRHRRQAAKLEAANITVGDSFLQKRSGNVMDFVKQATMSAQLGTWQVMEVQKMETPGEFLVWAMTGANQLQKLPLTVPRTLYVNIDKAHREAITFAQRLGGQLVRKDLPHGKDCLELYEITLPEAKFQRNEKALDLFFSSAEVEGVYESQVPLELKVIATAGCVAKVSNKRARNNASGRYQLSDLEMIHTKAHPYLDRRVAQFKKIFVYFASSKSRAVGVMGILGVFFLRENSVEEEDLKSALDQMLAANDPNAAAYLPLSCRAFVWVITGRSSALDAKPPLNRLYRKYQPLPQAEVKFVTTVVSEVSAAWKQANDRLDQYSRERQGPTVIIAQGGAVHSSEIVGNDGFYGMDAAKWRTVLPALYDFPLAIMPANTLDEAFPAVGWSMFAAERMVQRFLLFPRWFDDRLQSARFAQVPVCNLQSDSLTTATDVLFARQLTLSRHLLWASESNRVPDIGHGVNAGSDIWYIWSDPLPEPVINRPGVYRQYVAELDLYGLAVCAIMHAAELDSEGGNIMLRTNVNTSNKKGVVESENDEGMLSFDAFAGTNNSSGNAGGAFGASSTSAAAFSDQGCFKAFGVLKSIVAQCVDEVTRRGDAIADGVLTAIYRYLCGYGNGLLTDPQLHRLVYSYMVKLFAKLLQTFQQLGTQVIHADFNRIIIATKASYDLAHAEEYVDFILSAVSMKKTFSFLQLSVKQYWRQMIWLEAENWAALRVPEEVVEEEEVEEEDGGEEEVAGEETLLAEETEQLTEVAVEAKQDFLDADEDNDREDEDARVQEEDEDEEFQPSMPTTRRPVVASTKAAEKEKAEKKVSDSEFFSSLHEEGEGVEELYDDGDLGGIKRSLASNKKRYQKRHRQRQKKSNRGYRESKRHADDEEVDEGVYDDETYDDEADAEEDDVTYEGERFVAQRPPKHSEFNTVEELFDSFEAQDLERRRREEEEDEHNAARLLQQQEQNNVFDPRIEQHWNLVAQMPESAVIYFHFMIGEYFLQFAEKFDALKAGDDGHVDPVEVDALLAYDNGNEGDDNEAAESAEEQLQRAQLQLHAQREQQEQQQQRLREQWQLQQVPSDEDVIVSVLSHFTRWIERDFTSKMLEIIDDLNLSYTASKHSSNSVVIQKTLALDFVKGITHIMLLDDAQRETVATARRLLLAQLQVPEFSEASRFVNPHPSFVLHDVVCAYCSVCRDIDLLRDPQLLPLVQQAHNSNYNSNNDGTLQNRAWRCVHCQNALNREEVENRLIEGLEKKLATFLVQDFRCKKTHTVSRRLASALSPACEPLVMDTPPQQLKAHLQLLLKVAHVHSFPGLRDAVQELL